MADPQTSSRPAVTPRQLVVIGVLAVILVAVLIAQFGGASDGPKDKEAGARSANRNPAAPVPPPTNSKPASLAAIGAPEAAPAKPPAPPWPKLNADVAAQHDPFAVPESLTRQRTEVPKGPNGRKPNSPASTKNSSVEVLAALRSKGTSAVVRSDRGAAAVIGTRVLRIGDMVEGYRVVSIDHQGIMLEPVDRNSPPKERK